MRLHGTFVLVSLSLVVPGAGCSLTDQDPSLSFVAGEDIPTRSRNVADALKAIDFALQYSAQEIPEGATGRDELDSRRRAVPAASQRLQSELAAARTRVANARSVELTFKELDLWEEEGALRIWAEVIVNYSDAGDRAARVGFYLEPGWVNFDQGHRDSVPVDMTFIAPWRADLATRPSVGRQVWRKWFRGPSTNRPKDDWRPPAGATIPLIP